MTIRIEGKYIKNYREGLLWFLNETRICSDVGALVISYSDVVPWTYGLNLLGKLQSNTYLGGWPRAPCCTSYRLFLREPTLLVQICVNDQIVLETKIDESLQIETNKALSGNLQGKITMHFLQVDTCVGLKFQFSECEFYLHQVFDSA